MGSRPELHEIFCGILGSRNVYFQPPPDVRMSYPAIVYSRSSIDNKHANDDVYMQDTAYEVIVIDWDPDSDFVTTISRLPRCRFNRHYTKDNLNHDAFTIYW